MVQDLRSSRNRDKFQNRTTTTSIRVGRLLYETFTAAVNEEYRLSTVGACQRANRVRVTGVAVTNGALQTVVKFWKENLVRRQADSAMFAYSRRLGHPGVAVLVVYRSIRAHGVYADAVTIEHGQIAKVAADDFTSVIVWIGGGNETEASSGLRW